MTDRMKWLISYVIGIPLTWLFFHAIEQGWMPYVALAVMVVFVWSLLVLIAHQILFVWLRRLK